MRLIEVVWLEGSRKRVTSESQRRLQHWMVLKGLTRVEPQIGADGIKKSKEDVRNKHKPTEPSVYEGDARSPASKTSLYESC